MNRSLVLKTAAVAFTVVLAGCASDAKKSSSTSTAKTTAPSTDTMVAETTEVVEAEVDNMMAMMPSVNVVYFDYDQATVKSADRELLDAHAAYLMANMDSKAVLEGHADERGTPEYNLALGERRAKAASAYLRLKGVDASQLEVVSFGEEKPADLGRSDAAYSKNRRVEVKYQN